MLFFFKLRHRTRYCFGTENVVHFLNPVKIFITRKWVTGLLRYLVSLCKSTVRWIAALSIYWRVALHWNGKSCWNSLHCLCESWFIPKASRPTSVCEENWWTFGAHSCHFRYCCGIDFDLVLCLLIKLLCRNVCLCVWGGKKNTKRIIIIESWFF